MLAFTEKIKINRLLALLLVRQPLLDYLHELGVESFVSDVTTSWQIAGTELRQSAVSATGQNKATQLGTFDCTRNITARIASKGDYLVTEIACLTQQATLVDAVIPVMEKLEGRQRSIRELDELVADEKHVDTVVLQHSLGNLTGAVGDADRSNVRALEEGKEIDDSVDELVLRFKVSDNLRQRFRGKNVIVFGLKMVTIRHGLGHLESMESHWT